jgi:hypothetical protein
MSRKKPAGAPQPAAVHPIVNVILDQSGSMNTIREATILGFNEYLQSLKDTDPEMRFSLTLFDTERVETPYVDVAVSTVPPLTNATYAPRAGTPLYDAVCTTLLKIEAKLGADVTTPCLVVVITDGEENSSHEYNLESMKAMIARLTAKGNWTFAYQGANVDAWSNARSYGIGAGNTAAFQADAAGVHVAYASVQASTRSWHERTNAANYDGGISDPLYQASVQDFFDPNAPASGPQTVLHPTIQVVPPKPKATKRAYTTIK